MIFIERYPLKRCQGCVKLNCFLNINDLSEVQLCMSSNSWTWECPYTKDGADHVPLIFLSSVYLHLLEVLLCGEIICERCDILFPSQTFYIYFLDIFWKLLRWNFHMSAHQEYFSDLSKISMQIMNF